MPLRKKNTRRNTNTLGGRSRRLRGNTRIARNSRRQHGGGARRASRRQQRRLRSRGGALGSTPEEQEQEKARRNAFLRMTHNQDPEDYNFTRQIVCDTKKYTEGVDMGTLCKLVENMAGSSIRDSYRIRDSTPGKDTEQH